MHLSELSFINFKNYREANFKFSSGVNCFTGHNGAGKTNILDAIHYLCLCKSYFNSIDSQSIFRDEAFFVIQGDFNVDNDVQNVYCGFKKNHKKQFKRNQKEYSRLADHIGIYPLVMISPSDQQLILDGSEERRRFIDSAISQVDNLYLDDLIYYNKVLQNRNALLKKMNENPQYDSSVLEVFNHQLAEYAEKIYVKRKQFLDEFIPLFNRLYKEISSGREEVSIEYDSQLNEHRILELLEKNTRKDIITQRSNYGVHKDDLEFKLAEYPLKKFGSQGQQKSYLIALKLAHYKFLQNKKGYKPLLLLDDIFDKLDAARIKKLLAMVSADEFGQIFISDTDFERVDKIFKEIGVVARIFEIESGALKANSYEAQE